MIDVIRASAEVLSCIRRMCDYNIRTTVAVLCHDQSDKKRTAEIYVPYIMTMSTVGCNCDMRYLDLLALHRDPIIASFENKSAIYFITPEDNINLPETPTLLVYTKYTTDDDIHSTLNSIKLSRR